MKHRHFARLRSLSIRYLLLAYPILLIGTAFGVAAPLFPDPLYPTDYASTVAAADFNGDARLDLAIAKSNGSLSILLAGADGEFEPEHLVPMGGNPYSVAAADFNADGKIDLVVTDQADGLAVFLGDGNGNFVLDHRYPVGDSTSYAPYTVTVADLNLDGVPDLAVTIYASAIGVLLGEGDGTFHPATLFPAGDGPVSLSVVDFNLDGFPDLAAATAYGSQEAVILFGHGDGQFDPPVFLGEPLGGLSICSADFNRDGKPDLALVDFDGSHLTLFLGDGAGGVLSRMATEFGFILDWVASADFDRDGNPDLVTQAGLLPGQGDGTFGPLVPSGVSPANGVAADMNGDGFMDLAAIPDWHARGALILYNNRRGQLGTSAYRVPGMVVKGDFNEDGFTDLASAQSYSPAIAILLGHSDGSFVRGSDVPVQDSVVPIAAGDFDGDHHVDLVFTRDFDLVSHTSGIEMLRGLGNGDFQAPIETTTSFFSVAIFLGVGDFNGDGRNDLVCLRHNTGTMQILLGKTDGTFESINQVDPHVPASAAVAGDFDGDGKQDLVVAYPGIDSVSILPGNGDGTFRIGTMFGAGEYLFSLAVGDFNEDGKLDVAAGHVFQGICPTAVEACLTFDSRLSILLGHGDGTLGEQTRYDSGESLSIGVADFDGDGHLDLASNGATVFFGAGDGTFGSVQQYAHDGQGIVDDFNRDGLPDVASARGWLVVALNQANHHPVAEAGSDTSFECAAGGAEVNLDASASSDADSTAGTQDDIAAFEWFEDYGGQAQRLLGSGETARVVLPLGVHLITLRVTDHAGAFATDEVALTVADTQPPRLTVHLSPDLLWPANNKMVDITADVRVVDACGGASTVTLVSIQSRGQAVSGDDVSEADLGTADFGFQLRARRPTSNQGFSYLVTYAAVDAAGNQTTGTGSVQVPQNHR